MKKTKLDGPITTLRILVSNKNKTSPGYKPAHYGPAFDQAYQAVISQMQGIDPNDVDLEKAAKEALTRATREFPSKDGWTVKLVHFDNNEWLEVT